MEPEPFDDSRNAREAGPDEIEAWAAREHRRRQAWLAGPSEEEKQAFARRWRRRAVIGLEESRLGPSAEEVDAWAERERRRRQAWLAGPSDEEKRSWSRMERLRATAGLGDSRLPPTEEEAAAWAERERRRREQWAAGPIEAEKREWARRRSTGRAGERPRVPFEGGLPDSAQQFLREAELAGKGSLHALAGAPAALWSYLVRSGRAFEEEASAPGRRGRVRY